MDAPLQSADSRAELAVLRRRAYGPDADIAGDAQAVARLAELESDAVVRGVSEAPVVVGRRGGEAGVSRPPVAPAGDAEHPVGRATGEAGVSRPPARRRRNLLILAIAIVAAIVGAAATAGILAITAPGPDTTLARADVDPLEDPAFAGSWIGSFRVDRQGVQGYEEYRRFRPWSGIAADGLVCLFITSDTPDLVGVSCTPPGIPPVADVQAGNGTISLGGGPRMVVRFELRDDEVHVYDRAVPTDAGSP